ncbi:MAG: ribbon-helix-helix protein, CopG family [Pseudonocardia sp.]|nr:ribbon-helix-helix protein, CopG family [Pseudonocardia sp.]
MAMNVRFSDDEADALRVQAEREGRPQSEIVRASVRDYIDRRAHSAKVRDSACRNTKEFRTVLDRLGSL